MPCQRWPSRLVATAAKNRLTFACTLWETISRHRSVSRLGWESLNRLHADLAIDIDASEINGPVWSVSGRGTTGPLDRVAQIANSSQ
jgi:hypothetical protein